MQPHRIRRQRWQVKAPSPEAAFAWRGELSARLDRDILPAFERAFTAFAPGDEVLHIAQLTLNLQLSTDTATELADRIEAQLRAALGAMLHHSPTPQGTRHPRAAEQGRAAPVGHLASERSGQGPDTGETGAPPDRLEEDAPQPAGDTQAAESPPIQPGARYPSAVDPGRATPVGHLASGRSGQGSDTGEAGAPLARLEDEALQPPSDTRAVKSPRVEQGARHPDTGETGTPLDRLGQEVRQMRSDTQVGEPAPIQAGVRHLSAAEQGRALLVEYLASGRLGWYADIGEAGAPLARLGQEAQRLVSDGQCLATTVAGTPAARAIMYFRLLQLLSGPAREALPAPTADHRAQDLASLGRLAAAQPADSFLQLRVKAILLALRDADLPDTQTGCTAEPLIACATALAGGTHDAALLRAVEALLGPGNPTATADGTQATPADNQATRTPTGPPQKAGKHPVQPVGDDRDNGAPPAEFAWHLLALEPATAQAPGLPARDAGLVLLHPFLPRLFEATAITANRRLPASLLPRTAALLHWLATGRAEVFEFEISLIKVLLGLNLHDPLPVASGLLREADRAEADALLAAAIGHWSVLRNTSLAGLRGSFLQRRGLMREGERGWHLQVEPESFDLLLRQLPWGIGIVKLPWMTKPLFTDWPTP